LLVLPTIVYLDNKVTEHTWDEAVDQWLQADKSKLVISLVMLK